ncbi:MAG: DUF5711 family protein [Lachnospiraceae bacterium]|nr:DUF5711 family protein [Lachnospiraceae bacterium]
MATISRFPVREEDSDRDNMNFSQKLHLHKLRNLVVVLVCVSVIVVLATVLLVYYKNQLYTKITVTNSIERVSIETNSYVNNYGSIIVYSKDGVSCINEKGSVIWNMTYEMQNPILKRSSEYVGVGDYDGHKIYVVDSAGTVYEIDTTLPLRDFSVSKEGLVAAILEDSANSWVNVYNVKGEKIVEIKATMSKTGYPLCVAISGEVMAVSYLHVDSDVMKSGVTFYNFGGVGENVTDRIVSSYEYPDAVVPTLDFIDSDTLMALADNRLMFYEGSKIPKSTADILFAESVLGVYYGKTYVCLVSYDSSGEDKYKMDIYDTKGRKTGSYRYNMDFKDIVVGNGQVLIYNENECIMVDADGTEKYNNKFESPVLFVATTESAKRYLFVRQASIDVVKFE